MDGIVAFDLDEARVLLGQPVMGDEAFRRVGWSLSLLNGLNDEGQFAEDFPEFAFLLEKYLAHAKDRILTPLNAQHLIILCHIVRGEENAQTMEAAKVGSVAQSITQINKLIEENEAMWAEMIRANPEGHAEKYCAQALRVDIWETLFDAQQKNPNARHWDYLSGTNERSRMERLCAFAETRFTPGSLIPQTGDYEEAMWRVSGFCSLLAGLERFEGLGVPLLALALQGTAGNHGETYTALRVLEKWEKIPVALEPFLRNLTPSKSTQRLLSQKAFV